MTDKTPEEIADELMAEAGCVGKTTTTAIIVAKPFVWREPADIPPRAWLYKHHYVRQYLTCTIAPSGLGKTSLVISEALAMTADRPVLGVKPTERARVWIWNGEDPADELDRRIIAAMLHHKISPDDVEGYLFRNTGRDTPIIIARQSRNDVTIAVPIIDAVIETIERNKIDAVIIDPFVKSHRVSENDNNAIDMVATQWADIADRTRCAIELVHHPRKTGSSEVTVEDSRGASALISASRSARVLNRMSSEEAKNAGIDEATAWRYFRVDNGKASMAPRPERADWYTLTSVDLGNGDSVGAVCSWDWPNPFDGVSVNDLRAAQKEVAEGGPWRVNQQADKWVGKPIAKALKLDLQKKHHRQKVKAILETWTKNEMFTVVEGPAGGGNRHKVQFVEVGKLADS